jgi:xylulokinase
VSVEWFARAFLGSDDLELMTALASSAPPGSNRVIFLPYLQGERTPVWDPRALGVFVGMTASTERGDMARSVFEGTAFALRQTIESFEGSLSEIRAVGGGTRNALWNQVKADVLKTPLRVLAFQETGVLGAALMACLGTGVYGSFDEAVSVADRLAEGKIIEPNPDRAGLYDELFQLYTRVYPQTRDIVHELGNVGQFGFNQAIVQTW